jgi:hypothetical protein
VGGGLLPLPGVAAGKGVRRQQLVAAHVQQHELGLQGHGQAGGLGKRPVGDGKEIGENDEGRSHEVDE